MARRPQLIMKAIFNDPEFSRLNAGIAPGQDGVPGEALASKGRMDIHTASQAPMSRRHQCRKGSGFATLVGAAASRHECRKGSGFAALVGAAASRQCSYTSAVARTAVQQASLSISLAWW